MQTGPIRTPSRPTVNAAVAIATPRPGGIKLEQAARPEIASRLKTAFTTDDVEKALAEFKVDDFLRHREQPLSQFISRAIAIELIPGLKKSVSDAASHSSAAVRFVADKIGREISAAEGNPPIRYSSDCGCEGIDPTNESATALEEAVALAAKFSVFKLYANDDRAPLHRVLDFAQSLKGMGGNRENMGIADVKSAAENVHALLEYETKTHLKATWPPQMRALRMGLEEIVDVSYQFLSKA